MAEGFAFSTDSNWQREFEDAFEFTPTKDQLSAVQADQARHGSEQPDGPPAVRRRRIRQDRSGHARGVQSSGRRQTGGRAGADNGARVPALRDRSSAASPRSRCASRCSAASARRKKSRQSLDETRRREGRHRRSARIACFRKMSSFTISAFWLSTKSSGSACAIRSG